MDAKQIYELAEQTDTIWKPNPSYYGSQGIATMQAAARVIRAIGMLAEMMEAALEEIQTRPSK